MCRKILWIFICITLLEFSISNPLIAKVHFGIIEAVKEKVEELDEENIGESTTISSQQLEVETEYLEEIPSGVYHFLSKIEAPVVEFSITNNSQISVKIKVSSEISEYTTQNISTEEIQPGEKRILTQAPPFKPGVLETLTEQKVATLSWKVEYLKETEWKTLEEQTKSIILYAKDTMIWEICDEEECVPSFPLIVAWVTPHVREIDELIRIAAEYTRRSSYPYPYPGEMVGYQSPPGATELEKLGIVLTQIEAIYNALKDEYNITYINSPISYGTGITERVKLPKDSINLASANCIDGTVLFASALENIGLNPYIALIPGHAFIAWDEWENSGEKWGLETTMVNSYTYSDALRRGLHYLSEGVLLVSIKEAREIGLTPMMAPIKRE